jgi:hypothetical protein
MPIVGFVLSYKIPAPNLGNCLFVISLQEILEDISLRSPQRDIYLVSKGAARTVGI